MSDRYPLGCLFVVHARVFTLQNQSGKQCKHRFCSSTVFVHIEQKWLATATKIVVLTKMVAISTDFVHFGQKWLVMSMWSAASTTFVRFGINIDNDKMLHKNTDNVLNSQN